MRLLLALGLVLLLRAPFLNQAVQGDDIFYLAGAEHAQIEPAHPINFRYIVQGNLVDMEGFPHPPLNAWILGLLLAVFGDIREVPFHAVYVAFSLIAAASMWSLARRFSPHPLWATLLFLAVPAFVVNGNSLESDLPFLAFWMGGVALFAGGRYALAIVALALASMAAYQAILLTPILAVYTWLYGGPRAFGHPIFARLSWGGVCPAQTSPGSLRRRVLSPIVAFSAVEGGFRPPVASGRGQQVAILIPPAVIAGWQLYELVSIGKMPILVMTSQISAYGFQSLANKLRNACALTVHACWIVFPLLLPPAFLLMRKRRDTDTLFLAAWILVFFGGCMLIFFAGAARYLLPMAAPVALLVSRLNTRWLAVGFAAQMILSISLAVVNYQHWDGYRVFVVSLKPQVAGKRVWIDREWGLRYYLEAEGGLPIRREQALRPGDVVVTSELGYPVHFTTSGGALTSIAQREIRSSLPLRLIGLNTRSAYSTMNRGYLPFDISTGPIDRVRAEVVVERAPKLAYLAMNAPEAEQQLVSGVYELEGKFRWTAGEAVILMKSPAVAAALRVEFMIHPLAPARRITLLVDGVKVAEQTYPGPGTYVLESPAVLPAKSATTVTIRVDKTFSVPGDHRELGVVLYGAGFR